MTHSYRLGAYKLLSDIELPELMPWEENVEPADILQFRLGQANPANSSRRYVIPGPRRVVIEDGARVTVENAAAADLADTRALLMGPVQAILWHQRGLLPLHASAVNVKGSAIAIAGPSGAGKSTLAAAFAMTGHAVLADDICIVDPKNMAVLTGQRRLRLWRSALDHFGIPAAGLPRAMSRTEKFILSTDGVPVPGRQRLAHILLPVRGGSSSGAQRLYGSDATFALTRVVHMLPVAHELGLGAAVFNALTQLQKNDVAVWRVFLADDLRQVEDAVTALLVKLDG
jgi:hypothetical protein